MLANEARIEGEVAGAGSCGDELPLDRHLIPRALHSTPEVASVGRNEAQVREDGHAAVIGYAEYAANPRAMALGADHGVLKLVAEKRYGQVLGAQAVGPEAPETIAQVSFAMQMEATLEDLLKSRHAHPSMSEAIRDAARAAMG